MDGDFCGVDRRPPTPRKSLLFIELDHADREVDVFPSIDPREFSLSKIVSHVRKSPGPALQLNRGVSSMFRSFGKVSSPAVM
jgi:hypothetical protein